MAMELSTATQLEKNITAKFITSSFWKKKKEKKKLTINVVNFFPKGNVASLSTIMS